MWSASVLHPLHPRIMHGYRDIFSRLVEQISGRCPRYKSISRATRLWVCWPCMTLYESYESWSLAMSCSSTNHSPNLSNQPAYHRQRKAVAGHRHFYPHGGRGGGFSKLSEWKNDTADHCRYSTQHDAQHAAKMSVMQKIRTKFPRYDPLILCDILWLTSSLTVFSLAPGSAIPSAKRSFNRQRLVDTSLGTVYNFFLWFTEINIVSGCGKATARNQF